MTSESIYGVAWAISLYSFAISFAVSEAPLVALHPADRAAYGLATAVSLAAFAGAYILDKRRRVGRMNLRIAYYVVALAISLAAFAGAYGYANDASAAYDKARNTAKLAQNHSLGAFIASNAADDAADAAARVAYIMAAAVSLAAFAGAYILSKKAG